MDTQPIKIEARTTRRHGRYVLPQTEETLIWPMSYPGSFEARGKRYTAKRDEYYQASAPIVHIYNAVGEKVARYYASASKPTVKVHEYFGHVDPDDPYAKGERDIELEHAFLALVEYAEVSYEQYKGGGVDDLIRSGRAPSMTNKGQTYAAEVSKEAIEDEG